VVGVFPEATISRSYELKEFKAGSVRMAQAAEVPIVPCIVWGSQRIYTKGRPKDFRRRGKAITVTFGEPLTPGRRDDGAAVGDELFRRMRTMLDRAQRSYPDSPRDDEDRWWLPAALGGTAPTLEAGRGHRGSRAGVTCGGDLRWGQRRFHHASLGSCTGSRVPEADGRAATLGPEELNSTSLIRR
jgi:hypothetical protein